MKINFISFILNITIWLWFTLLFANFAESVAEGRSKAQAESLKSAKKDVLAKKLAEANKNAAITAISKFIIFIYSSLRIELRV